MHSAGTLYSEKEIEAVGTEIAEAIELAAAGTESWQHVTDRIVRAFPGSYCAFLNQDFAHDRLLTAEASGIEPELMAAFQSHFAFINPWSSLWTTVPDATTLLSERDFPASTLVGTEFYHDWVLATERLAAAGVKIDAAPDETLYVPLHYPLHLAPAYDAAAERLMALIRGPLRRAVDSAALLRNGVEREISAAALVAHSDQISFVVDGRMHLIEANQGAVDMMAHGRFLSCRAEHVFFTDPAWMSRFWRAVRSLERSVTSEAARLEHEHQGRHWIFRLFRISPVSGSWLLAGRPLILVLMKDLTWKPRSEDLSGFARLFNLTPAEVRFCTALGAGLTLVDAAVLCGITNETARDRIKAIFAKTRTSRQAELCVLLERYASA